MLPEERVSESRQQLHGEVIWGGLEFLREMVPGTGRLHTSSGSLRHASALGSEAGKIAYAREENTGAQSTPKTHLSRIKYLTPHYFSSSPQCLCVLLVDIGYKCHLADPWNLREGKGWLAT